MPTPRHTRKLSKSKLIIGYLALCALLLIASYIALLQWLVPVIAIIGARLLGLWFFGK